MHAVLDSANRFEVKNNKLDRSHSEESRSINGGEKSRRPTPPPELYQQQRRGYKPFYTVKEMPSIK